MEIDMSSSNWRGAHVVGPFSESFGEDIIIIII